VLGGGAFTGAEEIGRGPLAATLGPLRRDASVDGALCRFDPESRRIGEFSRGEGGARTVGLDTVGAGAGTGSSTIGANSGKGEAWSGGELGGDTNVGLPPGALLTWGATAGGGGGGTNLAGGAVAWGGDLGSFRLTGVGGST